MFNNNLLRIYFRTVLLCTVSLQVEVSETEFYCTNHRDCLKRLRLLSNDIPKQYTSVYCPSMDFLVPKYCTVLYCCAHSQIYSQNCFVAKKFTSANCLTFLDSSSVPENYKGLFEQDLEFEVTLRLPAMSARSHHDTT